MKWGLPVLLLAACQMSPDAPPGGFAMAGDRLPPEVLDALPAGTSHESIVVRDGCYYVQVEGQVRPIVTDEMRRAGFDDQPYCVM